MVLPYLDFPHIEYMIAREHESRKTPLLVLSITMLVVCYLVVGLRLVARRIQGMRLNWSDYLVMIALLLTTVMSGFLFRALHLGLGRHVITTGLYQAFEIAKMLYLTELFFPACNHVVKISILLLYRSIFGDRERWFNLSIKILIGCWIAWTIICCGGILFQCFPIELSWTTDHSSRCVNLEAMIMSLTCGTVLLNFLTLILPMPMVMKLKLTRNQKISVSGLFALGGADVIVCILRAIETKEIDPTLIDFTWIQCTTVVYGVLEPTIAIICACVITLRPVARVVTKPLSNFKSSTRGSSPNTSQKHKPKDTNSMWTTPFFLIKTGRHDKTGATSDGLTYADDALYTMDEMKPQGRKAPPYVMLTDASRLARDEKHAYEVKLGLTSGTRTDIIKQDSDSAAIVTVQTAGSQSPSSANGHSPQNDSYADFGLRSIERPQPSVLRRDSSPASTLVPPQNWHKGSASSRNHESTNDDSLFGKPDQSRQKSFNSTRTRTSPRSSTATLTSTYPTQSSNASVSPLIGTTHSVRTSSITSSTPMRVVSTVSDISYMSDQTMVVGEQSRPSASRTNSRSQRGNARMTRPF